jgi:hydroxyacylglutathione hydrolase
MELTGALATHYHPDHIGGDMMGFSISGVAELLELISVPVHIQEAEGHLVTKVTGVTDTNLVQHTSGDIVSVGSVDVELIHTPGHTPGSQCFFVRNMLVAGDTLFLEGCGRTDLPGGDPREMYESLTQRLTRIPDGAVLYPGHFYAPEPFATMGETRERNYVLAPRTVDQWLAMFGG